MDEIQYEKLFGMKICDKKSVKFITDAIIFLLSRQRIIEAKYHFKTLEKINPNHKIVMELGLDIGIKSLDFEMVEKYEAMLKKFNLIEKNCILLKRINYYLSINKENNAILLINKILDKPYQNNKELLSLANMINREIGEENKKIIFEKINQILKKRNLKLNY